MGWRVSVKLSCCCCWCWCWCCSRSESHRAEDYRERAALRAVLAQGGRADPCQFVRILAMREAVPPFLVWSLAESSPQGSSGVLPETRMPKNGTAQSTWTASMESARRLPEASGSRSLDSWARRTEAPLGASQSVPDSKEQHEQRHSKAIDRLAVNTQEQEILMLHRRYNRPAHGEERGTMRARVASALAIASKILSQGCNTMT